MFRELHWPRARLTTAINAVGPVRNRLSRNNKYNYTQHDAFNQSSFRVDQEHVENKVCLDISWYRDLLRNLGTM